MTNWDEVALRIWNELDSGTLPKSDTLDSDEVLAMEYARRLRSEFEAAAALSPAQAWPDGAAPYSDGYRRILVAIENLDQHDYGWRELVDEIRQIARTEYQKFPLIPAAPTVAPDAQTVNVSRGHTMLELGNAMEHALDYGDENDCIAAGNNWRAYRNLLAAAPPSVNADAKRHKQTLETLRQYVAIEGCDEKGQFIALAYQGSILGPVGRPDYDLYEFAEAVEKWLHEKIDAAIEGERKAREPEILDPSGRVAAIAAARLRPNRRRNHEP